MDTDHTLYQVVHAQELFLLSIEEKVLETAITTDSCDKEQNN